MDPKELDKQLDHFFPHSTEVYKDGTGAWHTDLEEAKRINGNLPIETYKKGDDGSWKLVKDKKSKE